MRTALSQMLEVPATAMIPRPLPSGQLPHEAALRTGRMHEATGPGRRAFAAEAAGRIEGPVLWLIETRMREMLCPRGLAAHFDPARLILVRPLNRIAVLQVMEEALRSGAAPLVVAELELAADLTQSRRLQLAAGTGGCIGLCLVPEGGLATNAAESRWHATSMPAPAPGGTAPHRWMRIKSKHGRTGSWEVTLGRHANDGAGMRAAATGPATSHRQPHAGRAHHA